ncbi:M23 family metallopeptidase [Blastococcus litoris]|uniref:M23 family metallopeptidase n=1 Tax=Blastococcus litoris TaxID=2171622 RepID=UPI001F12B738|nr:M23 family metallopeptidase [Blastococcus litoris]
MRTVLVAVLTGAVTSALLLGSAGPALAVPAPPPNPTDGQLGDARAQQEAAAAEVGRIAALVASAEAELERVGVLAEAAGTAYLAAEEALMQAQEQADAAAAALQVAADAVAASEARIALFSRDSYMKGSQLSTTAALLDSAGPGELIQRAAILSYVADNQLDVLGELEVAKVSQANAESAARAARDDMAAAEETAEAAKQAADSQLAAQQGAYEQVATEKAGYEAQLQAAQIHLLELQGARDAYQQWVAQKQAEEAAAARAAQEAAARAAAAAAAAAQNDGGSSGGGSSGGGGGGGGGSYVAPTYGRVSSCYGARWGVTHYGVDIAAPIGTPVYAATSGVVKRAGAATGFGQAVYILGDDGYVTVYGHVNRYFVSYGERVSAGEQIAEVGNRGQSTGPHLHFEVHSGGQLYSNQMNPVPWLNNRGVYIGGCGG